ncbi:sugar ABC transporter ATP-binding protein [Testudinibacter aquarius]|uniref:Monosaccharide ABC transporter ATP-binding protein (CUT2 family) n=1 Tax=Testudinibacter aquarius TaxID=1524974 RepID=A0A4R3Y3C9_9PAST|nr:sugar ABC transporter ATP-binding protein [Testudinibacter aquarius]KAE9529131.1 D-xylose ABC transporter ATP-binding protein [Testudinibacter aquarius]TCV84603.1 monosaccharide ABC transporter ATP-binding protein (CUT2 family) [Testudinibacter aquarius]TNG92915.1 sugar ABC transporter ATP-binding protein [Testudinibacter aquarius]
MVQKNNVILTLNGINKSFGAFKALKDMRLTIMRGRVHTLLGENGAGKSTLMKILTGVYSADSGEMSLNGEKYSPSFPQDAVAAGLSIVFQELSLVNNLTVAQNIYANHEPSRFGFINDRKIEKQATTLIRSLGLPINAATKVGDLSIAQRQLVEIAKALSRNADIVILDEPTSSLSDSEAEILFSIIEKLTTDGKAIIYISHRMEEIMRLSDDITIMRDGEYIQTLAKTETTIDQLIALMVGRRMDQIYPPKLSVKFIPTNENILEVSHLSVAGKVNDVNFQVKAGEILGFFGLVGAGRSDVMKALFGMLPHSGEIKLHNKSIPIKNASIAINHGIGFVTENRKEEGLVLLASLRHNITMAALPHFTTTGGLMNMSKEKKQTDKAIEQLAIRAYSGEIAANTLSGGNQQKVVLAKWLATKPKILILDEPTRGVDVGAKFEIYSIIRELSANGTAILLVSSELPELLGLSDRIIVMAGKSIQATANTTELNPQRIMAAATRQL